MPETSYCWKVIQTEERPHYLTPRANPAVYEQPADLLFDTSADAVAWRNEELGNAEEVGDENECAYIRSWVLCKRTVEPAPRPLDLTPAELRRIADILESNDDQPGYDMWSALAAMEAMEDDIVVLSETEFRETAAEAIAANGETNADDGREQRFDVDIAWAHYQQNPARWADVRDEEMPGSRPSSQAPGAWPHLYLPPPLAMYLDAGPWWVDDVIVVDADDKHKR